MKLSRFSLVMAGGLTGLVLILGASYLSRPSRAEPSFGGKRLTPWLKQLDDGEVFGISSARLPVRTPAQLEAAHAVAAMGAAALPLLMHDIHVRPSEKAFRIRMGRSIDRFTMSHFHLSLVPFSDVTEEDRIRWRAAQGLAALGPIAKPALPELEKLLFTNFFHSSIKEAAFALASIGPEGINLLTNAPNIDEWSGMCAIWALGQNPAAGTNVINFLVNSSASRSEGTACGAIQVLGLFHTQPAQVVPALISALSSPSASVRSDAARALAEFGNDAAPAVPQLRGLTSDPVVGASARGALARIEPKTDK